MLIPGRMVNVFENKDPHGNACPQRLPELPQGYSSMHSRARDGSGSLPKGVRGNCWRAAADGRKTPHRLQMPCNPEGAITDSPKGTQKKVPF